MRALKSTTDFNNTHWFMPSDNKKGYSYIQWSSDITWFFLKPQ
jgi:hypothetical protein